MFELISKMEKAMLAEFECPVCLNHMFPPIRQCVQGHCYCNICFNYIERCAICRDEKSDEVCSALEDVRALLKCPCRYSQVGCDFTGKSAELAVHEEICSFTECHLKLAGCNWKGKRSDMPLHLKTVHPKNYYEKNRVRMCIYIRLMFEPIHVQRKHVIMRCFNTLFRCTWDVEENGSFRIAIHHIGNSSIKDTFSFDVAIFSRDGLVKAMNAEYSCIQANDDSIIFLKDKCFSVHGNIVEGFLNERGRLQFRVNILKSDPNTNKEK